jgi:hypothetical protein
MLDSQEVRIYTKVGRSLNTIGFFVLENARLKATTHRVVNPDSGRDRRFAVPFFIQKLT